MTSYRRIDRKQFLVATAALGASGLPGCGGDDDDNGNASAGSGGVAGQPEGATAGTGGGKIVGGAGEDMGGTGGTGVGGSMAGEGGSSAGGSSAGRGGTGGSKAGGGSGGSATSGNGTGGTGITMCQQAALSATETTVGLTHSHTLMPSAMAINMGTDTYMTGPGGSNGHTHVVMLTGDELDTLRGGGSVDDKATTADATNHMHTYTIECKP